MLRILVHLDADAFFASVEQAADPRLRGRPIAVGGEKRGIVASASYEARKFGIHTPMPTVRARKLCPQLIVLPGDFEKYERFSRWMFSYAYDFTPDVEITSIDEGYFDLSGVRRPALDIAQAIRRAIGQSLKISVSEGIASNKLVSQIASKLNKPAAFTQIPAGRECPFLHPLPNHWLPGIGPQTSLRLNAAGLVRIGQIAATPPEMLQLLLGKAAVTLRQFANGIDDRLIVPVSVPAKSYSHQETFAQDQTDEEFLEATLRRMADSLMAKVRADRKSIRTVTVKVRYNDMDEDQCSESLLEPTDLESDLYGRLRSMLGRAWKRRVSLRLVSLKFSNVHDGYFRTELELEENVVRHESRRRLAAVVDQLRHDRGRHVVLRGHDLTIREKGEGRRENEEINTVARQRADIPSSFFLPPSAFSYFPLSVHSYYSFLDSTLSIDAVVELAQAHRLSAVALTDRGNLHGAVEFTQKARAAGLRPILGAELIHHGQPLWLYVENATGYANLCRILSEKAEGRIKNEEVSAFARERADFSSSFCILHSAFSLTAGLIAVSPDPSLASLFPGRFYQAVLSPKELKSLGADRGIPRVAVAPAHYAAPADRWKFDIVQSIRTLTLLRQAHPEKRCGGEFHFRGREEMSARFRDHPDLLKRTAEIVERCRFELPFHPPQFPMFRSADGVASHEFLRRLVFEGLQRRYADPQRATLHAQLEVELRIIRDVGYEDYFLVVWDILQECRRRGIHWITRGSAADSLVCYCLGISDVCPIRFDLYFHRFLNKDRMSMNKLPDIDVDFPHDRKDDVIDLIFEKYGAAHAAVVGGFSTFQTRSAFAEIAKVLGVAEREVRKFTEHFPWSFPRREKESLGTLPVASSSPTSSSSSFVPRPRSAEGRASPARRAGEEEFQEKGDSPGTLLRKAAVSQGLDKVTIEDEDEGRGRGTRAGAKDEDGSGDRYGLVPSKSSSVLSDALRARPDCQDLPLDEEPYRSALEMAEFLDGFPRYPKMHPCGVVLSRQPMHELTPTFVSNKGYPTTHFDMDAVEAIGLVKIDILAQGGLAVMRDVQDMLQRDRGIDLDLDHCTVISSSSLVPRPRSSPYPSPDFSEDSPEQSPKGRETRLAGKDSPCLSRDEDDDEGRGRGRAKSEMKYEDPAVWDMISRGEARAVHHIESPAMVGLCRMSHVRDIDGLIAIVSVIRPGAANEQKKLQFTRRYQGFEPVTYPHPVLEPFLRSTFGLVVYEEHILQICEAFAGFSMGRADTLRRALVKQKWETIMAMEKEFIAAAHARGHDDAKIAEVWNLVEGFAGYAFCKAHSTAYGVEAYQSAWLKCYFPAEFMAAVLSNGKGFYDPLVYVLECHRLGIPLLPPCVNAPGPEFKVEGRMQNTERFARQRADFAFSFFLFPSSLASASALRVPVRYVKGLTERTQERLLAERRRGRFESVRDFGRRVEAQAEEMEALLRVGAFDGFGRKRTELFWEIQEVVREKEEGRRQNEEFSFMRESAAITSAFRLLPSAFLSEPSRRERLEWERDLLGFPVSDHPLALHEDVAWETYCPVARLGEHVGRRVVTCGLVIEQRVHQQATGEPMKFLTLADWTGMVETELFATTYRHYGLATVRYPVLEVSATVEPFENGRGFSLRVHRAGRPRKKSGGDSHCQK